MQCSVSTIQHMFTGLHFGLPQPSRASLSARPSRAGESWTGFLCPYAATAYFRGKFTPWCISACRLRDATCGSAQPQGGEQKAALPHQE